MKSTTDNFPIISYILTASSQNKVHPNMYRKLKDIDLESFKFDLRNTLDSIETKGKSFAELNTIFNEITSSLVEEHAPKVGMKRKAR